MLCAPWYSSLDLISLLRVKKMMRSTMMHHLLAGVCGAYVSVTPVEEATVSGHICVYALFSSLAFFVNGFLAARHLSDSSRMQTVARLCGAGYAGVCAAHWGFHAQSIARFPAQLWPLPLLFAGFVNDDMVLMKWLFKYRA